MSDQVLEPTNTASSTLSNISFTIENNHLSRSLRMLSGVVDHAQVIQMLGFIKCVLAADSLL